MQIAIVGVSGYAGTILYHLLRNHPEVTALNLYYAHDIGEVPATAPFEADCSVAQYPFSVAHIQAHNDAVFFATPAGVTKDLVADFIIADFPVIDLSGDCRLREPAVYERWYHQSPAKASDLAQVSYNLADLGKPNRHYVANPGCYATAILLGLAPLVQNQLVADHKNIIIDAKSGTSGAGKKLQAGTQHMAAADNFSVYKLNAHQHIPEIMQQLQQWAPTIAPIQMTTGLLPIKRGIMATLYVPLPAGVAADHLEALQAAFSTAYADKTFIQVGADLPQIAEVVGTNLTKIGWRYNPVTQIATVIVVIDNLMKGAAGQAVQNFNHLFSFPEALGLTAQPNL